MPSSASERQSTKTSVSIGITSHITYTEFYLFMQHVSFWDSLAMNKNVHVVSVGMWAWVNI